MRLERVAAHVPAGARLTDIGSDHGYLPVALLRRGLIAAAVAGEVPPPVNGESAARVLAVALAAKEAAATGRTVGL